MKMLVTESLISARAVAEALEGALAAVQKTSMNHNQYCRF